MALPTALPSGIDRARGGVIDGTTSTEAETGEVIVRELDDAVIEQ